MLHALAVHHHTRTGGAGGLLRARGARCGAWTLLELLVVIGIITVLVALLAPAAAAARRHAHTLQCQSNLRSLGQALFAYAGANNGWLYPMDKDPTSGQPLAHFGCQLPPHQRWPAIVFKVPAALAPLPYDPASYTMDPYDPETFPPELYTPDVLRCPADVDPREAHSYAVNGHLGNRGFRQGGRDLGGRTNDQVILAGEKKSEQRDYYMQGKDFSRVVDSFRHGQNRGSNYLFLDGHVETQLPRDVAGGIDPWDVQRAG